MKSILKEIFLCRIIRNCCFRGGKKAQFYASDISISRKKRKGFDGFLQLFRGQIVCTNRLVQEKKIYIYNKINKILIQYLVLDLLSTVFPKHTK